MIYDAGMTSHQQTGTGLHLPPIRVPAEGDDSPSMARAKFIYSRDNGYREPTGHMDLVTNYQQQYSRKAVTPVRPIRNDRPREDPVTRFDGTTTNASDYRVWRYDNREKPLRHPNSIVPSNGKMAGPSHYVSEYGPPSGGLSSPVASRRPAADGSQSFSRQIPYSQQQTSPDHGLVSSSDRHQQTSADVTSVYQQTYGATINLRSSFPPASNTRSSEGYNMTVGGGVTKTRRNGSDMESNYSRDFTRKSIMKQAAYKPRGQLILASANDHPFEDKTTHCEAFQRWKSERLQQASTTPAAGTSTGGGTGRQPPSQLTLSWTPTTNTTNSGGGYPGRYAFAGRKMGAVDRINPANGAGLPTTGLDRTSIDFTGRRNNFTNGKMAENFETSSYRKDYADSAATAATAQRNAVSEGIVTIPGEDGLPIDLSSDLQTIYRRLNRHQPEDPVLILSSTTNNNSVTRGLAELASSGSQDHVDVTITEPVNDAVSNFVPTAKEAVAGSKPEVETVTTATDKDVSTTGQSTLSTSVPEVKPFDERRVSIIDQSESQAGQPRDQAM